MPAKEEKPTVTIVIDGTPHVFHPQDVSAFDISQLRRAAGLTMQEIFSNLDLDNPDRLPDIDIVAAMVWLARRQAGERELPYAAVASAITLTTQLEVQDVAESEAVDAGEVSAAG